MAGINGGGNGNGPKVGDLFNKKAQTPDELLENLSDVSREFQGLTKVAQAYAAQVKKLLMENKRALQEGRITAQEAQRAQSEAIKGYNNLRDMTEKAEKQGKSEQDILKGVDHQLQKMAAMLEKSNQVLSQNQRLNQQDQKDKKKSLDISKEKLRILGKRKKGGQPADDDDDERQRRRETIRAGKRKVNQSDAELLAEKEAREKRVRLRDATRKLHGMGLLSHNKQLENETVANFMTKGRVGAGVGGMALSGMKGAENLFAGAKDQNNPFLGSTLMSGAKGVTSAIGMIPGVGKFAEGFFNAALEAADKILGDGVRAARASVTRVSDFGTKGNRSVGQDIESARHINAVSHISGLKYGVEDLDKAINQVMSATGLTDELLDDMPKAAGQANRTVIDEIGRVAAMTGSTASEVGEQFSSMIKNVGMSHTEAARELEAVAMDAKGVMADTGKAVKMDDFFKAINHVKDSVNSLRTSYTDLSREMRFNIDVAKKNGQSYERSLKSAQELTSALMNPQEEFVAVNFESYLKGAQEDVNAQLASAKTDADKEAAEHAQKDLNYTKSYVGRTGDAVTGARFLREQGLLGGASAQDSAKMQMMDLNKVGNAHGLEALFGHKLSSDTQQNVDSMTNAVGEIMKDQNVTQEKALKIYEASLPKEVAAAQEKQFKDVLTAANATPDNIVSMKKAEFFDAMAQAIPLAQYLPKINAAGEAVAGVSSEDIFGSAADPEIKAALHKTTFDKLMRATVGAGGYTGDLDETDAYATDENGSNADVVKVLYDRMQKAGGTTNFSPQEMAYLQENFGAYNSSDSPTMPSYDSSVGSPARGSPHASVQSGPPLADGRIPIMGYIDPNHLQQSMEQSGIRVGTTGSSPNQG